MESGKREERPWAQLFINALRDMVCARAYRGVRPSSACSRLGADGKAKDDITNVETNVRGGRHGGPAKAN